MKSLRLFTLFGILLLLSPPAFAEKVAERDWEAELVAAASQPIPADHAKRMAEEGHLNPDIEREARRIERPNFLIRCFTCCCKGEAKKRHAENLRATGRILGSIWEGVETAAEFTREHLPAAVAGARNVLILAGAIGAAAGDDEFAERARDLADRTGKVGDQATRIVTAVDQGMQLTRLVAQMVKSIEDPVFRSKMGNMALKLIGSAAKMDADSMVILDQDTGTLKFFVNREKDIEPAIVLGPFADIESHNGLSHTAREDDRATKASAKVLQSWIKKLRDTSVGHGVGGFDKEVIATTMGIAPFSRLTFPEAGKVEFHFPGDSSLPAFMTLNIPYAAVCGISLEDLSLDDVRLGVGSSALSAVAAAAGGAAGGSGGEAGEKVDDE